MNPTTRVPSRIGLSSPTAQKRLPSLRNRHPSSPPPLPTETASSISRRSWACWSSAAKMRLSDWPSISASAHPSMLVAPLFQLVTAPRGSVVMMAVSVAPLTICLHCQAAISSDASASLLRVMYPNSRLPSRLFDDWVPPLDPNYFCEEGRLWPSVQREREPQVPRAPLEAHLNPWETVSN